jgi:hypothetical protein
VRSEGTSRVSQTSRVFAIPPGSKRLPQIETWVESGRGISARRRKELAAAVAQTVKGDRRASALRTEKVIR